MDLLRVVLYKRPVQQLLDEKSFVITDTQFSRGRKEQQSNLKAYNMHKTHAIIQSIMGDTTYDMIMFFQSLAQYLFPLAGRKPTETFVAYLCVLLKVT